MSTMWATFQKPRRLECDKSTLTDTYGKFAAEPFERGFGTTIGNSLRRTLLSSLQGIAVTAVKIEGVYHEFSTIPGVREDVSDIILNLKELRLKLLGGELPKTMYLNVKGPRDVAARDMEADADIKILNPDLHLVTLNKDGHLNMEMTVQAGRGYVPAEKQTNGDWSTQTIPIDAIFSPVTKVNFRVENTRVGQATDFDKLIIEVWTDGSLSPEDAIAQSAKVLKDHYKMFINFEEQIEPEAPKVDEKRLKIASNLQKSVDELELSVRSYNCLKNANIRTIADLVQKTEPEMLKTRNFGRKSLNEIKEILEEMDLSLGMKLDELETPVVPEGKPVPN